MVDALTARALEHLHTLDLMGNEVGEEGALMLAGAIEIGACHSLRRLELYGNDIKPKGMEAIADALLTDGGACLQHLGKCVFIVHFCRS